MDLRVILSCPRCGERREVHIIGGWDLKDVRHRCAARVPRDEREEADASGEWGFEYDPPRWVF